MVFEVLYEVFPDSLQVVVNLIEAIFMLKGLITGQALDFKSVVWLLCTELISLTSI